MTFVGAPSPADPPHRMSVRCIQGADGMPLTYYQVGNGPECVVITGAPGSSIRFWLPLMGLLRDRFTLIAMEYRGFPDSGRVLTPEEMSFDAVADDAQAVLRSAGAGEVHLLSWCLGGKLAWELYRREPRRVRSIVAVGLAYQNAGRDPTGPFSTTLFAVRDRVERKPAAAAAMAKVLRMTRFVPDDAYLDGLYKEGAAGPAATWAELLGTGGESAAPAYHPIDGDSGLRNYLRTYQAFRERPITSLFSETRVPVTVVVGTDDRITPLEPHDRAILDGIPGVRYEVVEGASHYIPVEFPRVLAARVREHVERACPT